MADEYTPEVSVAFKENLVRLAHEWAQQGRQCETFDQILLRHGLPGRDNFHDERYDWVPRPVITGEATEEEFETWKRETERYFWSKADEYGIGETADRLFEQAGLRRRPAFVDVSVVVDGTFSVPFNINMRETDDVINHITNRQVGDAVYNVVYYGQGARGVNPDAKVEWKARVAEDTAS